MHLDCVSKTRVVSEETLKLMAETTWKVIIQCRHQVATFLAYNRLITFVIIYSYTAKPLLSGQPLKMANSPLTAD